jgi:O-antigen/teichoic acid export membrane protein
VTLIGLAATLVSLGLTAGVIYEVSRGRWSVRRAFQTTYSAALVMGLVAAGVGLAVYAITRHSVFEGIPLWMAIVALSSLPPVLAYQFADVILLARERYEGYAALELSHSTTLLLVGAGLTFPIGLAGAVAGLPVAAAVAALAGALLLSREAKRDTIVEQAGSLRRALRFGLQSWGANLLQQVNYRFDVLILGGFAGAQAVGIYSVALTLTSIAWVFPQSLGMVLFPRTASLEESTVIGEVTIEESDAALAKSVRHGVLLTLPETVLISLLLLVAVPLLYGGKFADTTGLGFVLLPGVLLLGIGKVVSSATSGRGHPKYALYTSLVSMPLTLVLYFTLIPAFHSWGAAVASSISYGSTAFLMAIFFRRATRIGLREAFIPRVEDIADYTDLARLIWARPFVR